MRGFACVVVLLVLLGCQRSFTPGLPRQTPLSEAAGMGDVVMVNGLLEAKADPNEQLLGNETVLTRAVRAGQYDVAQLLIEHGANPKTVSDGDGPLEVAVDRDDLRMVKLLLIHGASPDRAGCGFLAINKAAAHGNTEIIDQLLRAGADINDEDPWQLTPLVVAVQNDNLKLAKYLVGHGADPKRRSFYGATLSMAGHRARPSPEMIGYLKKVGGNLQPEYGEGLNQEGYFKTHPLRRPTQRN